MHAIFTPLSALHLLKSTNNVFATIHRSEINHLKNLVSIFGKMYGISKCFRATKAVFNFYFMNQKWQTVGFGGWRGGWGGGGAYRCASFSPLKCHRINISKPNEHGTHGHSAKWKTLRLLYKFFTFAYTQNGCLASAFSLLAKHKKLTRMKKWERESGEKKIREIWCIFSGIKRK